MMLRYLFLLILLAGCSAQPDAALTASDRETLDRTAEAHAHDTPVPTPAATTAPVAEVIGKTISYGKVDGMAVEGYLVRPKKARGRLPGLIVIHEWWGLNDNVRDEAARLAAEGYVVLAVDLFGGKVATQPPEAMKLSQQLTANPGPADENLRAAYAWLDQVEKAPRIGTIGWCLGGRWSLRAALLLPDQVDATVIYYGTVKADDAELARLQMPILGLFASKDRVVPAPTVTAFEATMKRLGKDVDIHMYDGADHGFANPSGTMYEPRAAEDAWRLTTAFLKEHLAR
ncbi:MAG: dienelactone hydrolase family protein [Chromatiales bacterium]|nr:dienelactone hydrolase family protein [Chromatiales bacterium]